MPGSELDVAPLERFKPERVGSATRPTPVSGLHFPRGTPLPKEARRARLMSSNLRKALAEITEIKHSAEGLELLEEIRSSNRHLTALVAFVPFLGPWHIARHDGFPREEKAKLMRLSTAVTALAILWIAVLPAVRGLLPGSLRERLDSETRVLGNLAETYKAEHHVYPSIEVWQGSVQQIDARFFDPWDRPYLYRPAEGHVTIGTLGRDGAQDGTGADADFFVTFPE